MKNQEKKLHPLDNVRKPSLRRLLKLLIFIIIPILLYASIQLFYYLCNSGFKKRPYFFSHALGIIILILAFTLITSLVKTTKRSTIILSVIIFLFMVIQQIKIGYSQDPILFSDILFLADTSSLLEITGSTLVEMITSLIPYSLLLLALLVVICIFSYIFEIKLNRVPLRITFGIFGFAVLFIIYFPNDYVTAFMQDTFFDSVTSDKNNHTTTNIAYYQKNGVIAGMYGLLLSNRFIEPDSYQKYSDKLDEIMKTDGDSYSEYLDENFSNWGQPNIIMIFSESFWDIDKLDEIEFDTAVTSNLHSLKEKGIYAEMISPSFGGISANVEYEILTGSNLGFFSEGYIPYMQLINNSNYYDAPYVSTVLKSNGYTTKIASTWSDTLFNCARAYEYMKIDETMFNSDFVNPDKKGGRISEAAVVDNIINDLENKEKGQKIFHMSLTAQTHMPYYIDRYEEDDYDVHITKSNLPDELNEMIQCYAQGVYDADKELGRLYEYIQNYDEPTIIIFYGDHLPYLQTNSGENAYSMLEYFNTDDYLTNFFRKYNTQLLITGNFDLGADDIDYIGPDLVMPYVLGRCDLENESDYYNYLNSTVHKLPAFNCFVAVDNVGNLYNPDELDGQMKEVYEIRKCINWREYTNR